MWRMSIELFISGFCNNLYILSNDTMNNIHYIFKFNAHIAVEGQNYLTHWT